MDRINLSQKKSNYMKIIFCINKTPEERFIVSLPIKDKIARLGESRSIIMRIFFH